MPGSEDSSSRTPCSRSTTASSNAPSGSAPARRAASPAPPRATAACRAVAPRKRTEGLARQLLDEAPRVGGRAARAPRACGWVTSARNSCTAGHGSAHGRVAVGELVEHGRGARVLGRVAVHRVARAGSESTARITRPPPRARQPARAAPGRRGTARGRRRAARTRRAGAPALRGETRAQRALDHAR